MDLDLELLRRPGERVERGEDERLRVAVERKVSALLDKRARNRIGERPLRQPQIDRIGGAFVAAFVAGDERHRHLGAGPGMLVDVLGGAPDAAARARLRQRQRKFRRLVEIARRMTVGAAARHQLEDRLRADDAVVVLDLVGHLQAVRRRLRLAGERDGRRTIGDGGELPAKLAGGTHGGGAVAVDDEAALGRAAIGHWLRGRLRLGEPAGGRDVEIDLSAGADDQHAAGRHRDRSAGGLHRLARAQPLQDQRRLRGIGRRADPGIDTEIRGRDRALPVERRLHAAHAVAAGDKERGDHRHQHQRAQRHRVARRDPRHRQSGAQRLGRTQCPFDVGAPERDGMAVVGLAGDPVGDRGGGPVRQPGIAVEAAKLLGPARQPQAQQRQQRDRPDQAEQAETDGAADRRQPHPEPKPGQRQEQAEGGRDRRERRPQPLPQQAPAGAAERARKHGLAALGGLLLDLGDGAGTFGQVQLQQRESARIRIISRIRTAGTGQKEGSHRSKQRHCPISSGNTHSHGGKRSIAISASTSMRGRTSAHSPSRTSTSGTSGRVL